MIDVALPALYVRCTEKGTKIQDFVPPPRHSICQLLWTEFETRLFNLKKSGDIYETSLYI